jgi:hypothetical protein
MLTNGGRCTGEIKCRIDKAALDKNRAVFTSTLGLELRKKLVKCCIWSVALCGAETGTVWAVDWKQLEVLKCSAGEGWRRSAGPIV